MNKSRNLSLDILKIILAISVVFLHCHFLYDVSKIAYFATVEGIFRLAVPTFLIISGFYFFNISTSQQLKEWVIRLGSLYAIWMLFYSYFWFDSSSLFKNLFIIFNGYYILWYLIAALFSGIIVYFIKNLNLKIQVFFMISCFLIGCTIQLLGNLHIFSGMLDKALNLTIAHRNFLFVGFPFFMLGYLINKYQIDKKIKINIFIVVLANLMVITESLLNYFYVSKIESLDQIYSLFIAAPLLFLYFKSKSINGKTKEIANFSTAIYLIHPFILLILMKYYLIGETSISFIVLILAFISASLLILVNKKLKYIL